MTENETQPNIIDLVINQDPQGVQATFGDAITDVISDTLDQRKVEMSQDMFGLGQPEQASNDDNDEEETVDVPETDDPDEVEGDELSDEEWNELISSLEDEEDEQPSDEGEEKDDNN